MLLPTRSLSLSLALVAVQVHAYQLAPRQVNNDPYPACSPTTNSNCIVGGKYLVPILDFSNPGSPGDLAYQQYLPTTTFTLSQWTNNRMPEWCYYWAVERDHWNVHDFVMYNVTFADCGAPFVICRHINAPKSVSQIAIEIGRMPPKFRQSASTFLVYSDSQSENPAYTGYFGTYAPHGILIGRSTAYFATAIIHELGHAADLNLGGVPPITGISFSSTATYQNAVNADGYAVSAYGTGSYVENFAEAVRAVLLDNIYPGGLTAFTGNNPNLTHIANTLNAVRTQIGQYLVTGGTCDLTKKFPYPNTVDIGPPPVTSSSSRSVNTATATPYGQCGGWYTYTGVTLCGPGYSCTSLNPHYSQCTPTPVAGLNF